MIDRGEASGVEGRPQMIVLHGPNLNMLGRRSAEHYGRLTLEKIHLSVTAEAGLFEWEAVCHQTNCEGEFIELVQQYLDGDAFLVNPGAWTHYSYAVRDALEMASGPIAEVHISDIYEREEWRRKSVLEDLVDVRIWGRGLEGYLEAVRELIRVAERRERMGRSE